MLIINSILYTRIHHVNAFSQFQFHFDHSRFDARKIALAIKSCLARALSLAKCCSLDFGLSVYWKRAKIYLINKLKFSHKKKSVVCLWLVTGPACQTVCSIPSFHARLAIKTSPTFSLSKLRYLLTLPALWLPDCCNI